MVEDVRRLLAFADLERERLAGLGIGDSHRNPTIVLAPQQPYMQTVVHSSVELSHSCKYRYAHFMYLWSD